MFLWYDYLILCFTLLLSSLTGIYFGCSAKRATTTNEYLSGGKRMKILPIALSVIVGHFSTIALIAIPADIYKYGAFWLYSFLIMIIFVSLSVFVYYPALFKSNASSSFEYLEKRFDHKTKVLGSLMYILYENLLLPVIVYTPSLAVATVTGINVHLIAFIICGICVFYTAIGGLKTVIWTDLLQFTIVIISFVISCYVGIRSVGGISYVLKTASDGARFEIFDFDLDPTKKDSFWICVFGYSARFLYYLCLSQSSVQKYLSLRSYKACRKSLIIAGLCWCFVLSCTIMFGLTLYANYVNCDPVLAGKIAKNDQIAPYFVEQVSDRVPGISGIYMAALVSAGISTLSSSLNALSGVIYNDIIIKLIKREYKEKTKVFFLKVIVIIQGLICISLVFLVPYLGEILNAAIGITGLIDGPSLGLFTLGTAFPKIQANDAFYGTIGGVICMTIMYCPSIYYQFFNSIQYPSKSLNADNCTALNATLLPKNITETTTSTSKPFFLFRLTTSYYCFLGTILTIILAHFVYFIRTKLKTSTIEKESSLEIKEEIKPLHNFNQKFLREL